jgi:GMP synthase (glutamine-hydrolysing)
MSHGDQLTTCPPGFVVVADTPTSPFTAIAHESRPIFGVQFHPEVSHSVKGKEVIGKFVTEVCGIKGGWSMESFIPREIARIREICGEKGQVIGAVSGGVDSTVAAKIMHEAIGDRFHAIMVDNGVLRMDEAKQVHKMLVEDLGVNLTVIDASDLFLDKLKGVMDPEKKRKIIGNTFIEVFEEEAAKLEKQAEDELAQKGGEAKGKIEWLLQGTLYPDVIESISFKGPSATIKTHHNVGGLLENMKLKLIEPLRELFKGKPFCRETEIRDTHLVRSQTKSELSVDSSTSPPTWLADTPSLDLVSPSEFSVKSPVNRSRSCSTPTRSTSRKSELPASMTRSRRLSLRCCLSRLLVFRVTRGPTIR